MADKSKIEWTDSSWTPIRARNLKTGKVGWHCEHATTGCEFCYAEGMNKRLGTGLPFKPGHRKDIDIFLDEEMLLAPLRWKKPRMIFVCSMTDAFADFVTDEWLDKMFAVMALCPQHTFQCLTKRAERMRDYTSDTTMHRRVDVAMVNMLADAPIARLPTPITDANYKWPLPNCWLGVSAERQQEADERIPLLLQTPAAVRFISAEPLLGPIDLTEPYPDPKSENALHALAGIRANPDGTASYGPHLDWVIVGGESGPNARPMHPDWARSLRDQCAAAGVAFFHKQNGEWIQRDCVNVSRDHAVFHPDGRCNAGISVATALTALKTPQIVMERVGKKSAGRMLDGRTHDQFPERESGRC